MKKSKLKLSILMPVRNEGPNIEIMLKILRSVVEIPHEILIVVDHPKDNSIPVVKRLQPNYPHVKLVYNKLGVGVGNAIKAGVKVSKGDYILIFLVDDIGPVLAIKDMIKLMDNGCDMISCTRYEHGGRRLGGSPIGYILSKIGNKLFCFFSGSVFTDSTTGFKMFRRSIFDKINLESRPVGWVVVYELAIKAQLAGMKLGEVPIVSIDRLYGGESTFSPWPWFKEYFKWFLWGIKKLRLEGKNRRKILIKKPSIKKIN